MSRLRVLVYARYPAVRAGLRELLGDAGLEVVGELGANEGVAPIPGADVLVADVAGDRDLGGPPDDLAAALPVVYLVDGRAAVAFDDDAPARAYLPRDADGDALAAAVHAVAAGLVVLDPVLVRPRVAFDGARASDDDPPASLTPRELDVLRLVAAGLPNKGVALELGISEHTVKFHLGAVLSKLDAHSRTEAVAIAARRGLLTL